MQYGPTASYGSSVAGSFSSFSGDYLAALPGLPNGTYHFEISTTDASGATYNTPDSTFTVGSVTTPAIASFLTTDFATFGSWSGVYGLDGSIIIGDKVNPPSYVTITPSGNTTYTWAASTTDNRGLQKGSSLTDRLAVQWFAWNQFTVDLNFTDNQSHQVAFYVLDWDANKRAQRIDILDTAGNVLDSRPVSGFKNGEYLIWSLSGHVTARFVFTAAATLP